MWNSSKPIKFVHFQKLVNQSTLNKVHVLQTTKERTAVFMKSSKTLVVRYRERKKKTEHGESLFLKLLLIDFG